MRHPRTISRATFTPGPLLLPQRGTKSGSNSVCTILTNLICLYRLVSGTGEKYLNIPKTPNTTRHTKQTKATFGKSEQIENSFEKMDSINHRTALAEKEKKGAQNELMQCVLMRCGQQRDEDEQQCPTTTNSEPPVISRAPINTIRFP